MLLERQMGLVDDLDASQPLHVVDTFEARHDETQRRAVDWTHRLAVLPVSDDDGVQPLGERNALRVPRYPPSLLLDARAACVQQRALRVDTRRRAEP